MLETERVAALFADARELYADAREQLEHDKIRNAAEKAWGATKRATDALVLARAGREPRTTGRTLRGLRELSRLDADLKPLESRYTHKAYVLHGACFYDGMCEPEDSVSADIRETISYIRDAEELAGR